MLNAKQYEAMDGSLTKSLARFNDACDDMCTSRYIIASAKISTLLRTVAGSRPLYEFFAHAVNGFDFIEYFSTIKYRDVSGNLYLELPTQPQLKVAFTFCLLYALDTERLEFKELLHTFYTDKDTNAEYARFCYDVIVPFRNAVNDFMDEKISLTDITELIDAQNENNDSISQNDTASVNLSQADTPHEEPATADSVNNVTAEELISQIKQIVKEDTLLTTHEQNEINSVLESLSQALEYGESTGIHIMYIAVKNTLKVSTVFPKIQSQYKSLKHIIDNV